MSNTNFVSQQTAIKKYLNTALLLTNSTPQGHLRSCSHHYSNRNRHSYMNVAFYTSTFRLQIIFQPVRQACSPILAKKKINKADDCCPNGSLYLNPIMLEHSQMLRHFLATHLPLTHSSHLSMMDHPMIICPKSWSIMLANALISPYYISSVSVMAILLIAANFKFTSIPANTITAQCN